VHSPIIDGRFSDKPDREHGNRLKPVRTRDDGDKNLANAIVAGFRRIFPTLRGQSFDSFDFRRVRRYDVTTKTITIEFYII